MSYQSFDNLWGANTFSSDQCETIALPIDNTVRVKLLGAVNSDTPPTGLREEFWMCWINLGPGQPMEYFAALVQGVSAAPLLAALTPDTTLKPMILEPAGLRFGIRLPRNAPYLAYTWSGAQINEESTAILYCTRMSPPKMPSPPVI